MRLPLVYAILGCVLAIGCSQPSEDDSAGTQNPTPKPSASTTDIDGNYDVGGGREMYITCRGNGKPTILLEAGGGDDSTAWPRPMFFALVEKTKTCAYDRAGGQQRSGAQQAPADEGRCWRP